MTNEKDRIALVTGGASGIGEAVLRRFAEAGWHTVSADIDEKRGAAIVDEIRQTGADSLFVRVDMAVEIHRHEAGELQEAGIDRPHRAGIDRRHVRHYRALEPFDRPVRRHRLRCRPAPPWPRAAPRRPRNCRFPRCRRRR